MAKRPTKANPTDFELAILKVLWQHGPSTAREVLERLRGRRQVGYTTVLKMLQLMEEKGMVSVDRSARSHVYAPRMREASTLRRLVGDFVDRAFDGAADRALVHLVEDGRLGTDELDDLERKIAELRRREKEERS